MDHILERIHPDDRPHVMQTLQAATERGGVYDTQYRILLPADGQRWISSHGSVERDENGRARLLRGVSLDITQRMRTEQELLERRSELAHLSRVTMLGELSGSLAHELNQPLTAILSNAQAAQRFLQRPQPDLGEVAEILDDIVEADKRAGEVIRRMRDLMTKGEMQVQLLDINRLIQDVLKVIRVDLANRQVTVHTQLSLEIPLAKGDGVQLQQVLMNLLLNAADAMHDLPPGERRITVSTRRHERGGVQVCVDDSGAGVPESQWEEIFTAFHTTKPGGMGLGLAVSRTIVHAHGGTLSVRNLPAGGASFCFELPSVSPGTA
jgi:C4-dicarboxylate-specific signal transduction histidine kinase